MARKKKLKKYGPPGPAELCGFKRGDVVCCFRYPDEMLTQGEISYFHENTEEGPAFTFLCDISGSFRLALIKDIIEKPTKQQLAKINGAIVRKIRRKNQKPKIK